MTGQARFDSLPPIRTNLSDAMADLDIVGLARLAGAVDDCELATLTRRLADQAAAEAALGLTAWVEGPNQRVWNLINKGEAFRRLAFNPALLALMTHILGHDLLLNSWTANIANPGGEPMHLHGDQQFRGLGTLPVALLANAIWMLDDFTETNGATLVIPGSHRRRRWPRPDDVASAIPATGPAGTLLIYEGRLWHGTGANRTTLPRRALLTSYCRPFIRQQENFTLSVAPEVLERCDSPMRALLGFQTWTGGGALGMVNGSMPGVLNSRPTSFPTELGV